MTQAGTRTRIGRYALYDEIAAGGMASVHIARLLGHVGFSRTVAIKKLHPQFAKDPDFVTMFLDEARLVARIRHPNVVPTLDVISADEELFLVMEYVPGESLSRLTRAAIYKQQATSARVAVTIIASVLHGLHAAHEATTERGVPLGIVHRDVSPQNVLVGADGIARVVDFGIAKAARRATSTREGQIKGKLSYIAPEQLRSDVTDRRSDVFAASTVLWETITGKRLFEGDTHERVLTKILVEPIPTLREIDPTIDPKLDAVVAKGLAREPVDRYATAREMALALEGIMAIAPPSEIATWVEQLVGETLAHRAARVAAIESHSDTHDSDGRPVSGAPPPMLRQTTTASVESEVTLDKIPTRSRAFMAIAGGALLVVALVIVVVVMTRAHASTISIQAPTAASTPEPVLSTTPPPIPHDVVTASASASSAPVAAVTIAAPHPHHRSTCEPPFTIDSTGIRHIKPQCMGSP